MVDQFGSSVVWTQAHAAALGCTMECTWEHEMGWQGLGTHRQVPSQQQRAICIAPCSWMAMLVVQWQGALQRGAAVAAQLQRDALVALYELRPVVQWQGAVGLQRRSSSAPSALHYLHSIVQLGGHACGTVAGRCWAAAAQQQRTPHVALFA